MGTWHRLSCCASLKDYNKDRQVLARQRDKGAELRAESGAHLKVCGQKKVTPRTTNYQLLHETGNNHAFSLVGKGKVEIMNDSQILVTPTNGCPHMCLKLVPLKCLFTVRALRNHLFQMPKLNPPLLF